MFLVYLKKKNSEGVLYEMNGDKLGGTHCCVECLSA